MSSISLLPVRSFLMPFALIVAAAAAAITPTAAAAAAPIAEIVRVPAPDGYSGLTLALHHLPPARVSTFASASTSTQTPTPAPAPASKPNSTIASMAAPGAGRSVLFVHGATFPTALAAGYRFDGRSWMDELASQGFDVWGLDFLGYGESSRYPAMDGPMPGAPLGRAPEAARQIAAAVAAIRARQGIDRVSIVAHSWGTMPAGLFATRHQAWVDRLILFGPSAPAASAAAIAAASPAVTTATAAIAAEPTTRYGLVTAEQQRTRFTGYVPPGEAQLFEPRLLDPWLQAYLATDPTSAARQPASVRVPSGPSADIGDARQGASAYDPRRILAPTLIIRGEWDVVTTPEVAAWLYTRLSHARDRRSVLLGRGTHVMHLEAGRTALYREVSLFLAERAPDDAPPAAAAAADGPREDSPIARRR